MDREAGSRARGRGRFEGQVLLRQRGYEREIRER